MMSIHFNLRNRNLCRRREFERSRPATQLTNPSPINLAKIVHDWILIHSTAFKTLLNSTVYLGGGVAHALSTPRGVVCHLKIRRIWNGNPAAPFHLVSFDLMHRDDAEVLQSQWDGLMASCKKSEGPFKVAETPSIAGILPIVFCVKDNGGFVVNNYFPVSHTRLADDTVLDAQTRLALFGLNVHCRRCLDSGLVYDEIKKFGGEGTGALDLGRYLR
ncbi:hypothetical protein C8T65DRAFT_122636 [Cerioporus squamosus]|nr:hypothetical protein C8T65DRAFT_122636 [Cerioporus squamosus]